MSKLDITKLKLGDKFWYDCSEYVLESINHDEDAALFGPQYVAKMTQKSEEEKIRISKEIAHRSTSIVSIRKYDEVYTTRRESIQFTLMILEDCIKTLKEEVQNGNESIGKVLELAIMKHDFWKKQLE